MRLFEFGDLSWIPGWYHVNLRKYLIFFYRVFGYFRLWVPATAAFIEHTQADAYVELGSGGGETLRLVVSELPPELIANRRFILTDIHPVPDFVERINREPGSSFVYFPEPVDASAIPEPLRHPRIFINSFHHFSPVEAHRILDSSLREGQAVLILEYVRNSPLGYLSMLTGPLVVWLTLPFVVSRQQLPIMLVVTYLLPIFPLMMLWDGFVSCRRAYRQKSLQSMLADLPYPVELRYEVKRSLLYPAGVTAVTVMPRGLCEETNFIATAI